MNTTGYLRHNLVTVRTTKKILLHSLRFLWIVRIRDKNEAPLLVRKRTGALSLMHVLFVIRQVSVEYYICDEVALSLRDGFIIKKTLNPMP